MVLGEVVELRRGGGAAVRWSVLGLLLVAAGVVLVRDTGGHVAAWMGLVIAALVAGYFAVQLVAPGTVTVRLGHETVVGHLFGRRTQIAWEQVHVATVTRVAGDPVLRLRLRGDEQVVRLVLPVGADVATLHTFLGRRLGRSQPPVPSTLRPLDLGRG